ncbi:PLDc N-terminal domain-containing protein [Lipingzhangella sp. LS1_29]|uniref:PLDc N-terminal domain-containing protein n=1 Tax=Lipingzhangella rawalii TaxID=2055835 RepID=A0ABU2H818_9ACTN|nr:PLDc N-terminal domain-containing protein [Lipingzhangella rawalii]MDS1271428.1 PLDc N-terminal domain-containing protein [Lipingzhangella rawalii]
MDEARDLMAGLAVVIGILGILLALAVVVLIIAALISILMYRGLTGGGKLLWILVVLYFPVLGSVAWFVVGKKGYLNQALGIEPGPAQREPLQQGHGTS